MKLNKVISATIAAALILGAGVVTSSAQISYNIVPVNFALTLQQQANSNNSRSTSGYTNTYSYTTVTLKNKDILAILKDIQYPYSARWPKNLHLGYNGNEILVLDSTNNVLLYSSCGGENGSLTFDPYNSEGGVRSGTYTSSPYAYNYHIITKGYFSLYDDGYDYYIDISGSGLTQANESYDSTSGKGSEAIVLAPVCTGDWDDNYDIILSGVITAGGNYNNSK